MKLSKTELLVGAALLAGVFTIVARPALAEPDFSSCPPGKTCKIILLTPEQEDTLGKLIAATCFSGPYAQIGEVVKFYHDTLASAPTGKAPEPKPEPKK